MAESVVLIMASYWARSTLHWYPDRGWILEDDRPHEIRDDGVLAWFGDEGFRRRDALQASGQWRYEPLSAPLIGRRISEQIAEAGWMVRVDTRAEFCVERGGCVLAVDGTRPGLLRLDDGAAARETDRIDTAERWLLESALGAEAVSGIAEIMSVVMHRDGNPSGDPRG
ncbi:hypothetical protein KZC51_04210 [Microbacterium sp. SSW1-49]|uniref:Uncharacterized protein n=1 Tax=Microbacterium croceum TaxID=2851645 RepID=A0ABT0FB95_9MICO|nr:hypothetical protein [Microbacterium croceum]MCK2035333.1 hypothetical protein [Microbacterium croceum]